MHRVVCHLPPRVRSAVVSAAALYGGNCDEVRLRRDGQASLAIQGKNILTGIICTNAEIQEIFSSLCGHSLYAHANTIPEGFIITESGLRVGVVGQAFLKNGHIEVVSGISSLCIRLHRRHYGIAEPILPFVVQKRHISGVLVWSWPGVGKTTFLRELSFLLTSGKNPARTAIVDSRYELSADMCFPLADVLLGYPRSVGMEIAVRTMAPEVVVCDEIAGSEDAKAVSTCYSSGVSVIASAHAGSFEQLAKREGIGPLLRDGVFPTVVELFRSDGQVKKRITDASGRELMVCD